jgi:hypothetical protein
MTDTTEHLTDCVCREYARDGYIPPEQDVLLYRCLASRGLAYVDHLDKADIPVYTLTDAGMDSMRNGTWWM